MLWILAAAMMLVPDPVPVQPPFDPVRSALTGESMDYLYFLTAPYAGAAEENREITEQIAGLIRHAAVLETRRTSQAAVDAWAAGWSADLASHIRAARQEAEGLSSQPRAEIQLRLRALGVDAQAVDLLAALPRRAKDQIAATDELAAVVIAHAPGAAMGEPESRDALARAAATADRDLALIENLDIELSVVSLNRKDPVYLLTQAQLAARRVNVENLELSLRRIAGAPLDQAGAARRIMAQVQAGQQAIAELRRVNQEALSAVADPMEGADDADQRATQAFANIETAGLVETRILALLERYGQSLAAGTEYARAQGILQELDSLERVRTRLNQTRPGPEPE